MSRFSKHLSWIVVTCLLGIAGGLAAFVLHKAQPDPYWQLPLTKGDLYLCTALLIIFRSNK